MSAYLLDWLSLLLRCTHVVAAIAWIGASFYFVWLDNSLEPLADRAGEESGVAGELWAVHGGGFYRSRKYRVAPPQLPATLHWFYWEAYATWLSGFALLCLLYFGQAAAYLIDPAVWALGSAQAVGLSLGVLCGSWLLYDALCRSPLAAHPRILALALGALAALLAWALCQCFSGRGAYMLFGATLGTIMVANVLLVIIPGQRELVRAKREGRQPDPAPGLRGKQRSVHNTYFTLPVLFAMLSHHYAMTFAAHYNWLVLIGMSAALASLRAWFVLRQRRTGRSRLARALPAVLGCVLLVALIVALAPALPEAPRTAAHPVPAPDDAAVAPIIARRCAPCHALHPTQAGIGSAPNGLVFESPAQLRAQAASVREQLWRQTMPLGNLTGMSAEERSEVLEWLSAGARR